jgi:hypothetical protein
MGIENESRLQAMGDPEKRASAKIWIVTPRMSPNGGQNPAEGAATGLRTVPLPCAAGLSGSRAPPMEGDNPPIGGWIGSQRPV